MECVWEKWRAAGQEEGTRVRDGLRLGVTDALLILGEGFVQHPANEALRNALHNGELSKDAYFQQLLRLIYRLIFVFSVEERGLLHPKDDSREALAARRAYAEGYAVARLRDLCLKRRARNRFDDHWQALCIVFKGLSEGETRLALPALGGLFATSQCPALDDASLDNAHLLAAMQNLRWASHKGVLAPVDYRNMGPEELGSVYESLLELVPEIDLPARKFGFVGLTSEGSTAGNARKLSGSYYTPDSLVQELIKSALDPVIEQRIAAQPESPVDALLAIRVIDPACGSGHFLLAAARRLAEKLAQLRATDGEQTEQDFRHALREVVGRCVFGVDRNPMAIELARTALWLEGFEEGRPLGFLDHHLQVGDALLGLTDLKALEMGIPKDAFKPLSGDDKEVCKQLGKANAAALKDLEKKRKARTFGQLDVASSQDSGLKPLQALEALPENSTHEIAAKEAAYRAFLERAKTSRLAHAADLLVGAYLLPKHEGAQAHIPTSATLYLTLLGDTLPPEQQCALAAAQAACAEARALNWPLAFPQVFAGGGFDCVLGNPPWERIKLQEDEFFATRHRDIAQAKNKAERSQRIQWLAEGMLARHLFPESEHALHECEAEKRVYAEFISARRMAEAASVFAHVSGEDGGRYPLTGVGDVNTFALFAETISQIMSVSGRAGFIVPTNISTDETYSGYFGELVKKSSIARLLDFKNSEGIFPEVDSNQRFCLLTLSGNPVTRAEFAFFLTNVNELNQPERCFFVDSDVIKLLNPNSMTLPSFHSKNDIDIASKIYKRFPILIREARGTLAEQNPWEISFMRMFDMSNDSRLFYDEDRKDRVRLYESKMFHLYNHRFANAGQPKGDRKIRGSSEYLSVEQLSDSAVMAQPRYFVAEKEVQARLQGYRNNWLIAFRNVTGVVANERTLVCSILPRVGSGNSAPILLPRVDDPKLIACFIGNLSCLVFDYFARQKVGGVNLNFFIFKQLPIIPPTYYAEADLTFVVPRVLELTYTARDLQLWAQDLGYNAAPFAFHPERRAILRAELDAYYAKLYGLTRDELRYILDPADVMGANCRAETFRVLKNKEQREFGEYRTQRLVLEAWEKFETGDLH